MKPFEVTFATSCYEKDWEKVLDSSFLKKKINNHKFVFKRKILIINNVINERKVISEAQKLLKETFFTDIYLSSEFEEEVFHFFQLKKDDFLAYDDRLEYKVSDEWVYYNALAPLTAIYLTETDYLLYTTGDIFLEEEISWIEEAIGLMEKKKSYKIANLTWDYKYKEALKESYKIRKNFFISKRGFSDQLFLGKVKDLQKPIYSEIRKDAHHFPRGDVFEKRVFSYMINHKWKRITYKHGSYLHTHF